MVSTSIKRRQDNLMKMNKKKSKWIKKSWSEPSAKNSRTGGSTGRLWKDQGKLGGPSWETEQALQHWINRFWWGADQQKWRWWYLELISIWIQCSSSVRCREEIAFYIRFMIVTILVFKFFYSGLALGCWGLGFRLIHIFIWIYNPSYLRF